MKLFIVAAVFLVASFTNGQELDTRVTGGYSAAAGLAKCYVAMTIDSENSGMKTCGGCLLPSEDKIVTSASCMFSLSEGKALAIKFYTGLSGPVGSENSQIKMKDIFKTSDYDVSKNTSNGDVAVVTLKEKVKTTTLLKGAVLSTDDKEDAFAGEELVACGHGFIDNNRTRPGSKGLQCTTLRVVPGAECAALLPGAATPAVAPKGMICTKNIDDRNVCGGDQGSPVFSNKTGSMTLVGVVSFYPDARQNARCRDGHYAVISQLASYKDFVQDPK